MTLAPFPKLRAARYTDRPFPPYRFVPGRFPHPTAHPQGHSYRPPDAPEPEVRCVAPDDWQESEDYLLGCDLYNHAYWWEAHEAWEGLWRTVPADSTQHAFLQGLIQVSAAHLQLFMGRLRGVNRLRRSSRAHLARPLAEVAGGYYMGVALRTWVASVESYFSSIVDGPKAALGHDAGIYPYLALLR